MTESNSSSGPDANRSDPPYQATAARLQTRANLMAFWAQNDGFFNSVEQMRGAMDAVYEVLNMRCGPDVAASFFYGYADSIVSMHPQQIWQPAPLTLKGEHIQQRRKSFGERLAARDAFKLWQMGQRLETRLIWLGQVWRDCAFVAGILVGLYLGGR